ncbi:putative cupin [Dinoroseobacter shibae DFL 12 = DSM 16493]|jgi:predicted cupin superfamily sugar epimerase|uniref:Putative cupin n=1 Tax=Dinoroseobacter shibae (strain DSM 16493 / NCIMB 14021 / DFL 12) TaxID=398580 RepID=A8LQL8_DINSH|nr:cupin domain-containing protein [Dinoroseobacter shibae]ABV93885.1 putative cupin [Dinoroseobacter shibae DFL 12 = DSM 16493]URF45335.1 cupin domain-containing protein [Dinoroseobacter shibae]URF49640.1 cupin domain-containing protein [Dinoroseobacter shibae]
MTADEIIRRLDLAPHPEGGWYRQTWVAEAAPGARPAGTAIYFLLKTGERSHWHKVDATEIWLWHGGAPLDLWIAATKAGPARHHRLCADLDAGSPQAIVPPDHWQAATSTATTADGWSLVSCTVSPGFRFEGFTLAPAGFDIPRAP